MPHGDFRFGGPLVQTAAGLTVGRLFRQQVAHDPARLALVEGRRQLSYAELNTRVNRLANALAAQGIGRGDRVAILAENRLEYVELQLAAAKLGVIVACQNWRLAPDELVHCLSLVEPSATFVSERFAAQLAGLNCDPGQIVVLGDPYEHLLNGAADSEPPDLAHSEDGLVIIPAAPPACPRARSSASER
jgi:acyl-CoA synthetase (AMP-forming)/AMP-acid ligase II